MGRVSVKASKSVSQAGRHTRVVNIRATVNGRTATAAKAMVKKR